MSENPICIKCGRSIHKTYDCCSDCLDKAEKLQEENKKVGKWMDRCHELEAKNDELKAKQGETFDFPITITPEAVDKMSINFVKETAAFIKITHNRILLESQEEIAELKRKQAWIDAVGRPNHPDDERPWVPAYLDAMKKAKQLEEENQKLREQGLAQHREMRKLQSALTEVKGAIKEVLAVFCSACLEHNGNRCPCEYPDGEPLDCAMARKKLLQVLKRLEEE